MFSHYNMHHAKEFLSNIAHDQNATCLFFFLQVSYFKHVMFKSNTKQVHT